MHGDHNQHSRPTEAPVWDIAIRLFHWLAVALVILAFVSAKFGDSRLIWHQWNGYGVLVLVTFRILWGLVGSSSARFTDFVTGPRAMLAYVQSVRRGHHPFHLGHNPLGAAMVVALLLALLGQGVSGLFTTDDVMVNGPLVSTVRRATSAMLGTVHRVGFWVIVAMVAVHVAAVLVHMFGFGENLIYPMLTGRKQVPQGQSYRPARLASPVMAALILAMAAAIVWGGLRAWPPVAELMGPAKPAVKDDW